MQLGKNQYTSGGSQGWAKQHTQSANTTPSKRPRELEEETPHKRFNMGSQSRQQPQTPSRTPQQRARCFQDILAALPKPEASAQSPPSTPTRTNRQQEVKVEAESEDKDLFSNTDDNQLFNEAPGGLSTPPSSQHIAESSSARHKGKGKAVISLVSTFPEVFATKWINNVCVQRTGEELELSFDEVKALAEHYRLEYIEEFDKNARYEFRHSHATYGSSSAFRPA